MKKTTIPLLLLLLGFSQSYAQIGLFRFREYTILTKKEIKKRFFFKQYAVQKTQAFALAAGETAIKKKSLTVPDYSVEISSSYNGNPAPSAASSLQVDNWVPDSWLKVVVTPKLDSLYINVPLRVGPLNYERYLERKDGLGIVAKLERLSAYTSEPLASIAARYKANKAKASRTDAENAQMLTDFISLLDDPAANFIRKDPAYSQRDYMINYHNVDDPNMDTTFFMVLRNRQKLSLFSFNMEMGIPIIPIKVHPFGIADSVTNRSLQRVKTAVDKYEFGINGNIYLGARLGKTTYTYDKYAGMKSYNISGYMGIFGGVSQFTLKPNNAPYADTTTAKSFGNDKSSISVNLGVTAGFDIRGFQLGTYFGWDIPIDKNYRNSWYFRSDAHSFFIGFGIGYAINVLKGG